jgi:hypothetical protein
MMRARSSKHVTAGSQGTLYLNDEVAGAVIVRGYEASWNYGEFTPTAAFSKFAALFGEWSLLMHADGGGERLSEAAGEELRRAECAIDALRARIYFPERDETHACAQINLDGSLIEWKEY